MQRTSVKMALTRPVRSGNSMENDRIKATSTEQARSCAARVDVHKVKKVS